MNIHFSFPCIFSAKAFFPSVSTSITIKKKVIHRSQTVWHGQALLEVTHLRAVLLTACLSRLLVNRIAPPNLLLQHLPAWVITTEITADAQSDHYTKAFPPINQHFTEGHILKCRQWTWIITIPLNNIQKGLEGNRIWWCGTKGSIIITWTADE